MSIPKIEVKKILERLPDDSSYEDIQYHIYVREKVEKGLLDVKNKNFISHAEIESRMEKWLGK